ncbi:hypothetical protein MPPM_1184 [Methylorubrum populi]|uniref:Uncharacterized protein n=1 Tax=Methylorubrum populi TaxID=223967 RepID=A0A160PAJ8_9HYPH|nr:hypothetical protein [Methylorubrum populi]BAU89789.1 hypothetical protein MPPM_1184 [Methylorubrum populi]
MDESRGKPESEHDSLRNFNANADRNGQDFGQDSPLDVARPADLQRALQEDPSWEAQVARTASDFDRRDSIAGGSVESVEATEAETPSENLRRISDPTFSPKR